MGGIAFQVAGDEVADDDAAGATVHHHEVHHLAAGVQFHCATGNFTAQGTVGTEQQLLSRLPLGVEGAAYLCAAKRAVVQQPAIVAGKGYALRHALVDDGTTDLS